MCRDLGELLAEGLQTEAGLDVQKLDRDPSTRQQANCPGVPMVGRGQAEGLSSYWPRSEG